MAHTVNREGPYRVPYLPTGTRRGTDLSKDTEGVSVVSREGDRQRKKKSRANCVRLPVPVAAICEAGEKRMREQRWEEVSPSGLRV